jgi:hypothetical protein
MYAETIFQSLLSYFIFKLVLTSDWTFEINRMAPSPSLCNPFRSSPEDTFIGNVAGNETKNNHCANQLQYWWREEFVLETIWSPGDAQQTFARSTLLFRFMCFLSLETTVLLDGFQWMTRYKYSSRLADSVRLFCTASRLQVKSPFANRGFHIRVLGDRAERGCTCSIWKRDVTST